MTDLPLMEMVVTFGFKSDYPRFKMLLGQVEADSRWIVVRDIGLSRDPEAPGAVLVRMSLATYFSTREGVPPTPRPAAATSVPAGRRR